MAILTEDMKRVVNDQRLGFHATVCEDGSPNLSPKGTTLVWDDDHPFFADICSPQTLANIRRGSLVEVNVVDPFVRKSYRLDRPWFTRSGKPGRWFHPPATMASPPRPTCSGSSRLASPDYTSDPMAERGGDAITE
jgi:hypothetical protein